MVDSRSLLNFHRVKPIEGSNPSPSAKETSDSGYSSGLLTRDSKESREFESHRLRQVLHSAKLKDVATDPPLPFAGNAKELSKIFV